MDTLQTLSLLAKPILSRYDRCWFVDPAPMPLTLYDFALSGNCHKIRLMLSFLDLSYIKIPTSVKSGETRTPEFLQINPFGQVPVLVDQDCTIRDSLAILVYLVRKYANDQHWLPQSPAEMAQVLSWVAVGNVEVQNSIATLRKHYFLGVQVDKPALETKSYELLQIFDQHLAQQQWLACSVPTIADIACFPYIALAGDAQLSLDKFSHVRRWLRDFQQLKGYVSMAGIPEF
jgi:glutathione S-transferase